VKRAIAIAAMAIGLLALPTAGQSPLPGPSPTPFPEAAVLPAHGWAAEDIPARFANLDPFVVYLLMQCGLGGDQRIEIGSVQDYCLWVVSEVLAPGMGWRWPEPRVDPSPSPAPVPDPPATQRPTRTPRVRLHTARIRGNSSTDRFVRLPAADYRVTLVARPDPDFGCSVSVYLIGPNGNLSSMSEFDILTDRGGRIVRRAAYPMGGARTERVRVLSGCPWTMTFREIRGSRR
jgi:hypothetical protein